MYDLCLWALAHADSLFFLKAVCGHAPFLCADIPGAQGENVCASMVHIQCSMCVLLLVLSLTTPNTNCPPLLLCTVFVHFLLVAAGCHML